MTTDCERIRSTLLEAFLAEQPLVKDTTDHLRDWCACAACARRHQEFDARLASLLTPPALSPQFRSSVRLRVQRDAVPARNEWLPDVMPVMACVVAVLVYAMLAPAVVHVAVVRGLTGALAAYAALTIASTCLDDSYC